ncbi:ribosome-associated ATPase/putative transporter RbbA [Crateriforma conspicua]|uniref:ribosome-associated ATPase/putative transporter RbbA n=1 Tax=Crateriforma conspicua TaxID=2527996 RepID=UPI00118A23E3|nr:ribosome-associated ATPase/putative transporter RbbA [Crateriforma conspicua]QDV64601.1 putative ABC transporter ATP-binding protein YbhF [Crateriforma conspicua]
MTVTRIESLTHRYGDTVAVDDVTLELPGGEMVGLIGPDGVGKSTLMALIAGAKRLQTGDVVVMDGSMRDHQHRRKVCPRIAYMPQGLGKNLYAELSVTENLHFFGRLFGQSRHERDRRIDRLLRSTGLHPFRGRPAGKLSGGMKQKLGLCCALIHDPDLLILDEPTTGVDPLSREQFWTLIDEIRQQRDGMSVFVSTAYMEEAERFDWLVAMNAGKVLAEGTPRQIKGESTTTLEEAFVGLLPESERGSQAPLSIPPLVNDGGPPAIIAQGLTRRFGNFTAVDHVSFEIAKGEIFGFLGSNGCGKTTTMKMLTGLLPASEGTAKLFNQTVDAHNLDTRRRVGYMSQAFSLYEELTVRQNLMLHARLFSIEDRQSRVRELANRFGLVEELDQSASQLPLGVRQRLSLAVAILHRPEMLILDEPTSGVDPVARDGFWRLLVDLSRQDNVTIFISTHFMNEAMRCDRISLMHAGKVLACDAPDRLIQERGESTLDRAFVGYIQDAIKDDPLSATPDTRPVGIPQINSHATEKTSGIGASYSQDPPKRFSLRRLLAYSYRETLEVMRDPVRLGFALAGSVMLMLVLGFGMTTDVEDLRFAVFDQDQTPQSREYVRGFAGSRYFLEQTPITSQEELQSRLVSGDVSLVLEIPPDFGRRLVRGDVPEVFAWVDGAMPFRGETIAGYTEGVHVNYIQTLARQTYGSEPTLTYADLELRYRYNPSFQSINAMVPSVPPMLLILIPAILMAVSVAKEKELGSVTNFYVTPTTRTEFLIGKQLPYVGIAMVNFGLLTWMGVYVFGVPMKGDLWFLVLGALFYVTATTGLGLLTSCFTGSQVAAVFATAIVAIMPTVQFSGMMQPVSTLSGTAQWIGSVWPTTYFMRMSVGAFTKGLGATDLMPDLLTLALFAPFYLFISVVLLRKQER